MYWKVLCFIFLSVAFACDKDGLLYSREYQECALRFTEKEFRTFMETYNRKYVGDEYDFRFQNFKNNLAKIVQHNMGNHTFTLGINQFADLTPEEFRMHYLGYIYIENPYLRSKNLIKKEELPTEVPKSVDWVEKGVVTDVKNQGSCGSCWAFSTVGSLEGACVLKNHPLVSYSEQQLVDCATKEGNKGCQGGIMDWAFEYILKNGGLCTEKAYPYQGKQKHCNINCESECPISGFKDIPSKDELVLKRAVAMNPLSVAIQATFLLQFYSGGIFNDFLCASNPQLNHGVLLVGYGEDDGKMFWKIKNSWGETWGEKGYVRFKRTEKEDSVGLCGITMQASFPQVK